MRNMRRNKPLKPPAADRAVAVEVVVAGRGRGPLNFAPPLCDAMQMAPARHGLSSGRTRNQRFLDQYASRGLAAGSNNITGASVGGVRRGPSTRLSVRWKSEVELRWWHLTTTRRTTRKCERYRVGP
jgi:hypothetical protein